MSQTLIQLFNGIQYGLLIFLSASGLTLIFGILGVINLAHGSFYMLGAYLAFTLVGYTGSIYTALLIGLPLSLAFGALIEWLFMRHLYKRDHFNEVQRIIWGSHPLSVPIPESLKGSVKLTEVLNYPYYRLALTGFCLALAALMMYVIQSTKIGRLIRAGESNREMVEILGFSSNWLYRFVFAAGVALAAIAGIAASPVESLYPNIGDKILITSFVVVVIGGIGSVKGAFIGAILIGVADSFGKVFLPDFASVLVYALMACVLVLRPTGLFGRN
jgi:branched-chain amino acid transport system permease protein